MKRLVVSLFAIVAFAGIALAAPPASTPDWGMNATIIEACSCPMFCQCYFNAEPAGHGEHGDHDMSSMGGGHFCRFNNAFQINKGHSGAVKLDGTKFWVYGDLGGDFSKGQMDWGVVTFDKASSKEQRDAIVTILGNLYPVKWNSLTTSEGKIDWVSTKDESYATIDDGKTAEVRLTTKTLSRNSTAEPMVIRNLKYWGAPRNDGFILMPNTVEAVRTGDKPFEFNGTNGFMITVDINSKDVAPAGKG